MVDFLPDAIVTILNMLFCSLYATNIIFNFKNDVKLAYVLELKFSFKMYKTYINIYKKSIYEYVFN